MDELERFKAEINLADVAAIYGYALDQRESSRASLVMRRASDGDKGSVIKGKQAFGCNSA